MTLPITLVESGRCLIVGGGNVALRKAKWLLASRSGPAEPTHDLLSPALQEGFYDRGALLIGLNWIPERYASRSLREYRLVFACTNHPEVNRHIALDARQSGALVNVADAPELCDFHVPATLRREALTIAFSADAAPALCASLREEAESLYPAELGLFAARIRQLRAQLKEQIPADPALRQNILHAVCAAPFRDAWLALPDDVSREQLLQSAVAPRLLHS